MFNARHFYVIFNPSVPAGPNNKQFKISQAHDFYNELSERVNSDHEKPYLYWGKIMRSSKSAKEQFNIEEARKVIRENNEKGINTHLYISDFNYFWVAKVEDVSKGYDQEYFKNSVEIYQHERDFGAEIEAWFKITDMTLVSRGHKETHQYIGGLYLLNEKKKKSLDPYISGLNYPMIVMDDLHDETLFDSSEPLVKSKLRDDESFYEKIHGTINKYCIENESFRKIATTARDLIIRAEMDFYDDRIHNLDALYLMYYKALEVQLNEIVIHHLKENWSHENIRVYPSEKGVSSFKTTSLIKIKENDIHIKDFHKSFSIRHLLNTIFSSEYGDRVCEKHSNNHLFREIPDFYSFVTKTIKPMTDLIDTRNEIVHENTHCLTLEEFKSFRAKILGIGQESILVTMVKSAYAFEKLKKKAA